MEQDQYLDEKANSILRMYEGMTGFLPFAYYEKPEKDEPKEEDLPAL